MRQQVTFNSGLDPQANQFPSLSSSNFQNQQVSSSGINNKQSSVIVPEGTGRFREDQKMVSQLTGSSQQLQSQNQQRPLNQSYVQQPGIVQSQIQQSQSPRGQSPQRSVNQSTIQQQQQQQQQGVRSPQLQQSQLQKQSNQSPNRQEDFQDQNYENQFQQQRQTFAQQQPPNASRALPKQTSSQSVIQSQISQVEQTLIKQKITESFHIQASCPEHFDKEVTEVCLQLGCLRPNPLMCQECSEDHLCDLRMPYAQFVNQLNSKFQSQQSSVWTQVDQEKTKLLGDLQSFFQQLSQQIFQSIIMLEPLILKKILCDDQHKLELKGQFMSAIMKTNFRNLSSNKDYQQLTSDEAMVIKLIQNEFVQLSDIIKLFATEKDTISKRMFEIKQEMQLLSANFVGYLEDLLSGEIKHQSEQSFKLYKEPESSLQQKTQLERMLTNVLFNFNNGLILAKRGSHIIDFCHVSKNLVASASNLGDILIWKVPFYSEVCRFQHGIECTSLATCLDELKQKFLISAGRTTSDYQIYLWNIDLRSLVVEISGHNHPLRKALPLPKWRLAWCSQDNIIKIWDLKGRQEKISLSFHSAWINDLARLNDKLMASCSRDHTVSVFDFENGRVKYKLKDETYITCICSIDEETFAFGNYNGYIKIYQTEFPVHIQTIRLNSNWVDSNCIWFNYFRLYLLIRYIYRISSSYLAASSANGQITILNIDKRKDQIIKQLQINSSKISEAMLYIENNKQLITAQNQTIQIYQ